MSDGDLWIMGIEDVEREIERAAQYLSGVPFGVERAMIGAFNRAAMAGRTEGARQVRAEYTVPYKEVLKSYKLDRATRQKISASVESKGASLRLSTFRHNPKTDTTGARRRQVRVSVKQGSAKPIGQGFVHKGNIFQRVGKTSRPIKHLAGPAIPVMLNNPNVVDAVQGRMVEVSIKRLDHEVGRILAGHGRQTRSGANRW